MNFPNRIPLSELREGGFYRLISRNIQFGVYTNSAFIGIRKKFDFIYLDEEIDWEKGGTARPLKYVKDCPIRPLVTSFLVDGMWRNNKELFDWILENSPKDH